ALRTCAYISETGTDGTGEAGDGTPFQNQGARPNGSVPYASHHVTQSVTKLPPAAEWKRVTTIEPRHRPGRVVRVGEYQSAAQSGLFRQYVIQRRATMAQAAGRSTDEAGEELPR